MSAKDKVLAAAEALLLGREERQRQELEAAAERIRQEAKKQEGEVVTLQSEDNTAYMREYRIRSGRCTSVNVPVSVLQELLAPTTTNPGGVLRRHYGTDMCNAILAAPKA